MPQLAKARLQEITWDTTGKAVLKGDPLEVQFNPESLKGNYSNQISGGDQRGGAAIQFSGRGTSKLSFDLWFDVTAPDQVSLSTAKGSKKPRDVRELTREITRFLKPEEKKKKKGKKGKKGKIVTEFVPPGVQFLWGDFLFDGVMESVSETVEFFAEDGTALRASLSVSLLKQNVDINLSRGTNNGSPKSPGTEPQEQARQGDSLQSIAARAGRADWQSVALDNGIENPRRIPAGTNIRV